MPEPKSDVVGRYYELLNARDVERCSELLAHDFELLEPSLPDGGAYRGAAGLRTWIERLDEAWSEARWEPQDFIEAGDWVIVPVRFVSKGTHTAIEQVAHRFQLIRVEDGRIAFATGFGTLAKALEAAGVGD
jgi:ketosteroid isomerase-like protein